MLGSDPDTNGLRPGGLNNKRPWTYLVATLPDDPNYRGGLRLLGNDAIVAIDAQELSGKQFRVLRST